MYPLSQNLIVIHYTDVNKITIKNKISYLFISSNLKTTIFLQKAIKNLIYSDSINLTEGNFFQVKAFKSNRSLHKQK